MAAAAAPELRTCVSYPGNNEVIDLTLATRRAVSLLGGGRGAGGVGAVVLLPVCMMTYVRQLPGNTHTQEEMTAESRTRGPDFCA